MLFYLHIFYSIKNYKVIESNFDVLTMRFYKHAYKQINERKFVLSHKMLHFGQSIL